MTKYKLQSGKGFGRMSALIFAGMVWTSAGNSLAAGPAASPAGGHGAPSSPGASGSHGGGGATATPAANQPAARQPTGTSTGNNQSSTTGQRSNHSQYDTGWYGNPWSPYAYGWGGDSYSDNIGDFAQPTFTDSSAPTAGTTPTSPAVAQPALTQSANPPQTASGAAAQMSNAVDKSPEMVAANNAVSSAQAAYVTERGRVLSTLSTNAEYQQALDRKHNAVKVLEDAKSTGKAQPTVIDAATEKLDAGDEVTKIREDAVSADPGAAAARSKLMQAIADRDALRVKMMEKR